MELTNHITDLITVANEMKKQPNANKKAINKTLARLEEAQLWSTQINSGKVNGVPTGSQPLTGSTTGCTCPDGVTDSGCVVHGNKI